MSPTLDNEKESRIYRMSSLRFKVITDPSEAKSLWERFSPHETIDDNWDFRAIFSDGFEFPLHFIVGYDKDTPVGLLALQRNTVKGLDPKLLGITEPFLEFFGGIDTDDNRALILPGYEESVPDFLGQIHTPSILTDLKNPYSINNTTAVHYTDRFELDLKNLTSFEDFLKRDFSGKSRGTLVNKMNHMYKNHKVEILDGSGDDLNLLFSYSQQKFGESSSFHMPYRQEIYKNIMKKFDVDLFTISIDGVKKGVAYCIVYNQIYTLLNIGYDHELRDIGKLLVAAQIDRAIKRNCQVYDAGKGDNGWKERYHLQKIPQYNLTLNLPSSIQ